MIAFEAIPVVFQWIVFGSFAIIALNTAALLWALIHLRRIKRDSEIFFSGKDGQTLESTILANIRHIKKMDNEIQELFEAFRKIHLLASKGIYRVGLIRFNPFKDVGGNQSFALALLDGDRTGVVLSSLYTREGTRIYAKPVLRGEGLSTHPLTDEESRAVREASARKVVESNEQ